MSNLWGFESLGVSLFGLTTIQMIHVGCQSLARFTLTHCLSQWDEPTGPMFWTWDFMGRRFCSADSEKCLQQCRDRGTLKCMTPLIIVERNNCFFPPSLINCDKNEIKENQSIIKKRIVVRFVKKKNAAGLVIIKKIMILRSSNCKVSFAGQSQAVN